VIGALRKALATDAAPAVVSTAVRSVGRMVAAIVIARMTGLDGFATFTLLVTVELISVNAINALLASPPTVLAQGRRSQLRSVLFRTAERTQTLAAWPLSLAMMGILVASGLPLLIAGAFSGYLFISTIFQARRATYIARFNSRPVLRAEALIACAAIAVPLAGMLTNADVLLTFWISQAIVHGLALLWIRPTARTLASRRAWRVARGVILRTGAKMLAGSIATSVSGRSLPLLIGWLIGPAAIGVFGAANTAAAPIRLLSGSIRGALLPRLSGARGRDAARWTGANTAKLFIIAVGGGLAIVAASAIASPLLTLVFGDEFRESQRLVPLVVAVALVALASSSVSTFRQGQGASGFCAFVRWMAAAATPLVAFAGASLGGLQGVVIGSVALEVAILAVLIVGPRQRKGHQRSRPRTTRTRGSGSMRLAHP